MMMSKKAHFWALPPKNIAEFRRDQIIAVHDKDALWQFCSMFAPPPPLL